MGVVLTRPVHEAERWAAQLRERGFEAIVLPLLAIAPAPDAQALRHAAAGADAYRAVMFVSANAAHGFFAAAPRFEHALAWAPGPATQEALREAGVPEARISAPPEDAAQFDSEHLWPLVQDQVRAGDRVLVVRGGDADGRSQGRDWLLQQLAQRGVAVETVAAYTRAAPWWSDAQRASAQRAAGDGSLWLFSSSEAVGNLGALLPGHDWSRAQALATHPRIAQAAQALGFGVVRTTRPGRDAVLASIESSR
jgi:uroporphyrinogen-III synthase